MHAVCCWDFLDRDGGELSGILSAVFCWVLQHGRRDVVCVHSIYLSCWYFCEWGLGLCTVFASDCVHCERTERAAAVHLECDHAGGELDRWVAGWAGDCGKV